MLSPEELYMTSYTDFSSGRYMLALQGFQKYLNDFPDTENAADARYWIGEIYYTRNDFLSGYNEFKKVVSNYPQSSRLLNALLKMGSCAINMNNIEDARKYLELVIQRYPQSQEAAISQSILNELQ